MLGPGVRVITERRRRRRSRFVFPDNTARSQGSSSVRSAVGSHSSCSAGWCLIGRLFLLLALRCNGAWTLPRLLSASRSTSYSLRGSGSWCPLNKPLLCCFSSWFETHLHIFTIAVVGFLRSFHFHWKINLVLLYTALDLWIGTNRHYSRAASTEEEEEEEGEEEEEEEQVTWKIQNIKNTNMTPNV